VKAYAKLAEIALYGSEFELLRHYLGQLRSLSEKVLEASWWADYVEALVLSRTKTWEQARARFETCLQHLDLLGPTVRVQLEMQCLRPLAGLYLFEDGTNASAAIPLFERVLAWARDTQNQREIISCSFGLGLAYALEPDWSAVRRYLDIAATELAFVRQAIGAPESQTVSAWAELLH